MPDPNRPPSDVPKKSSSMNIPNTINLTALLNAPGTNPRKRPPLSPPIGCYERAQHARTSVSDPSRPRTQGSLAPSAHSNPSSDAYLLSSDANPTSQSPAAAPTPNPSQEVRTNSERAYHTFRAGAISAQRQADRLARCALSLEKVKRQYSGATTRDLGDSELAVAIRATVGLTEDEVVKLSTHEGYGADEDDEVWRELVRKIGTVVTEEDEGEE